MTQPHLRGPTGTMALPPRAAAEEEGLGWPRGDCSLRWAMRPAMEVGVVGAGVAGVPPVPAVNAPGVLPAPCATEAACAPTRPTWFGFEFGFGFGFGFGVGVGFGVEQAGTPRRATRPRYPNPNRILTLT